MPTARSFTSSRTQPRQLMLAAAILSLLVSVAAAHDEGVDTNSNPEINILNLRRAPRDDPAWAVFVTCALSHVTMLPTMQLFWRRRWLYEFCVCAGSLICSFMYHSCQAFNSEFFLTEIKWHILDNIFVICNFANLFVYFTVLKDARIELLTKASAVFVALLTQIRAPWDISHTIVPVIMYGSIPIGSALFTRRVSMKDLEKKRFAVGGSLLAIAVPFFVLGLDDLNDPCRIFHGLWHLFVGISAYYLWRAVKNPQATNLQGIIYADGSANMLLGATTKTTKYCEV